MQLYTYYRSSAAYRVRIGLNLKRLAVEHRFVDLKVGGGPEYAALNPQRFVPVLVDGDFTLSQSLAILEYLEERHPEPALLPSEPRDRARVRALAAIVCCDVHPLQNLKVQRYLAGELAQDEHAILRWVRHWIDEGLLALEAMLAGDPRRGEFCHGSRPTLADICLVPQLYNAERYGCDLSRYPTLLAIRHACNALPAFRDAHPERQPDAPGSA